MIHKEGNVVVHISAYIKQEPEGLVELNVGDALLFINKNKDIEPIDAFITEICGSYLLYKETTGHHGLLYYNAIARVEKDETNI